MNYVQYFGSILAPPLTDEERALFEQLHQQVCLTISEMNGRVLLGGVLTVPTNFDDVLAYLTQLGKEPRIYIVQNVDGSDYQVTAGEGEETTTQVLFPRDLDAYNAFFPEEEVDDGEGGTKLMKRTEHTFGGWPMPNDQRGDIQP